MSNRRFVWVSCSGRELVTSFTSRGDPEHILQAISEEFGVRIDHLNPSPLPRATAVASVTHRTNQMRASSLRFQQRRCEITKHQGQRAHRAFEPGNVSARQLRPRYRDRDCPLVGPRYYSEVANCALSICRARHGKPRPPTTIRYPS